MAIAIRKAIQNNSPGKSSLLFGAMAAGLGLQWGHSYSPFVRYLLMAMLFLAWVDGGVSWQTLKQPRLWRLLVATVGIAIATASGLVLLNPQLAAIAALLAVTPTALAAPVVTGLLGGKVEFVTASVLLTNGLMALVLPLLLRALPHSPLATSGWSMLAGTLSLMAIPLALAQLVRYRWPPLVRRIKQARSISFYLWSVGLYLASAKVGHFIGQNHQDWTFLIATALVALALCIINFGLGRWLGRPGLIQEAGQALGQKNTLFAVWVCLTFLTPSLALGPMFYIVFQNLYNAYLLAQPTKG